MPITGRLTTAGRIIMCGNYPQEFHDDLNFEEVNGIVLEMDEANTRAACGRFLNQRVAIWAADELAPRSGSPAMEPTPENMQHLDMRLEAAEERLAREVRSNEAATRVRVDLEARLKEALQDFREQQTACMQAVEANMGLSAEVDHLAAEVSRLSALYAEALGENVDLQRQLGRLILVDDAPMPCDDEDRALVSDAEGSLLEISEAMDD